MRIQKLLRTLLGLEETRVLDVNFDDVGVVVDVAPTWRLPRCSGCGNAAPGYDCLRDRRWRHLDLAGMLLRLRYDTRRVNCPSCGVKVEQLPWAEVGSWFTRPFEDHVGYLAQRCDRTAIKSMMRVAWDTVGAIIQRVVGRRRDRDPLDGLTQIGVDELSYRRHHEYITVVVDHRRGHVVWARPGKNADTLKAFFDELGPKRCAKLEAITIDMSAAYIKAVTECSPQAQLIFDRFHVQRLAQDAVDEVRRDEVRAADSAEERKELKGTRWPLLKSFWNLSMFDSLRLAALQRENKRGHLQLAPVDVAPAARGWWRSGPDVAYARPETQARRQGSRARRGDQGEREPQTQAAHRERAHRTPKEAHELLGLTLPEPPEELS